MDRSSTTAYREDEVAVLRNGSDRIAPSLASVGRGVHGNGGKRVEAAVVEIENLRVVEGVAIGAVYPRVASKKVVRVGPGLIGPPSVKVAPPSVE